MLHYDRIDVSKVIDVNKTKESHKCIVYIIYNYYYFFKINVRFQLRVHNGCHDSMQKAAIIIVKEKGYQIYFWYMSKDETTSRMNSANLRYKKYHCKKISL